MYYNALYRVVLLNNKKTFSIKTTEYVGISKLKTYVNKVGMGRKLNKPLQYNPATLSFAL